MLFTPIPMWVSVQENSFVFGTNVSYGINVNNQKPFYTAGVDNYDNTLTMQRFHVTDDVLRAFNAQ